MAKGKHEGPSKGFSMSVSRPHEDLRKVRKTPRKSRKRVKILPIAAVFALLIGIAVGGTMAYLTDQSDALTDTYEAGVVNCTVNSDYAVENTGNVAAYIRAQLILNYVDENGDICVEHGNPVPTNPEGWILIGDYYYYAQSVQPGDATSPVAHPISGSETDSCKVQISVNAEAIQALPPDAVKDAWGYSPDA